MFSHNSNKVLRVFWFSYVYCNAESFSILGEFPVQHFRFPYSRLLLVNEHEMCGSDDSTATDTEKWGIYFEIPSIYTCIDPCLLFISNTWEQVSIS